jgi:hypothetical protein
MEKRRPVGRCAVRSLEARTQPIAEQRAVYPRRHPATSSTGQRPRSKGRSDEPHQQAVLHRLSLGVTTSLRYRRSEATSNKLGKEENIVTEAGLRDASKAHGTAATDGKSALSQGVEVHGHARTQSDRISTVEMMSKQEDWLHTATADPAFWIKEIS